MRYRLIRGGREPEAREPVEAPPRVADDLAIMVDAARRGSREATRTLVSAVGPAILKTLRRLLGWQYPELEDIAQESLLAFVKALAGFRNECSTLHFACRIAVNTGLKRRRADAARPPAAAVELDAARIELPDADRTPLESAISAQRRALLRQLLGELPDAQAEALALHLMLGHSIEEVAATVGAPGNTIRSRIRLAKEALRARIDGDRRLGELLAGGEDTP